MSRHSFDSTDPDEAYNLLIRPHKYFLSTVYIKHRTLLTDLLLLVATAVGIFNRQLSLKIIYFIISSFRLGSDSQYIKELCLRTIKLRPLPPLSFDNN